MLEAERERREYRRVSTRIKVDILKYDEDFKDVLYEEGTSKNVSLGGLLVLHDKSLEVPSYVIASFRLPGSDERLDFLGKAVRIEDLGDGTYEVGVMFMRMILGEFKKLNRYITDVLKNADDA